MNQQIRDHVEFLFQGAPISRRAVELKEELIVNLNDRYEDLVQQGETEEVALAIVIASIGDVDELVRELREQAVSDPLAIQSQRQKSAMLVSISVGLFIVSIIFPIIAIFLADETGKDVFGVLGAVFFFICVAAGVSLLVYNARSKPAHIQMEATDVSEWNPGGRDRHSLHRMLQSLIWTATVPLFLCIGIFFDAWHPGWLVFLLAPVASQIMRLAFLYQEEKK